MDARTTNTCFGTHPFAMQLRMGWQPKLKEIVHVDYLAPPLKVTSERERVCVCV